MYPLSHLFNSYNANGQSAAYSQSSYSQPAGYGQQQTGYQAQQASYGQPQGQPQQQAPPSYPPQAASAYGQPPANQYGQQGGPPSYNQNNHYSKIYLVFKCLVCFYSSFHAVFFNI